MTNIINKDNVKQFSDIVNSVCNETYINEGEKDWTQEDIDLFVSQFNDSQEGEPIIDMNRLDPHFLSLQDYYKKYSGFDDEVIETMWRLDNKKLEDLRIPPLTINNKTVKLTDNLSNVEYIDDASKKEKSQSEAEAEAEAEAETEADGNSKAEGDADS